MYTTYRNTCSVYRYVYSICVHCVAATWILECMCTCTHVSQYRYRYRYGRYTSIHMGILKYQYRCLVACYIHIHGYPTGTWNHGEIMPVCVCAWPHPTQPRNSLVCRLNDIFTDFCAKKRPTKGIVYKKGKLKIENWQNWFLNFENSENSDELPRYR